MAAGANSPGGREKFYWFISRICNRDFAAGDYSPSRFKLITLLAFTIIPNKIADVQYLDFRLLASEKYLLFTRFSLWYQDNAIQYPIFANSMNLIEGNSPYLVFCKRLPIHISGKPTVYYQTTLFVLYATFEDNFEWSHVQF